MPQCLGGTACHLGGDGSGEAQVLFEVARNIDTTSIVLKYLYNK